MVQSVSCDMPCAQVHAILVDGMWHGQSFLVSFTAAMVTGNLRRRLVALGVDKPSEFATHAFRRGHAVDMQMTGRSLAEILRAGICVLRHLCLQF